MAQMPIEEVVEQFSEQVHNALEGMEKGSGIRTLSSVLGSVESALNNLSEQDTASIMEQFGSDADFLSDWQQFSTARQMVGARLGKVAGVDRTVGEKLARKLRSAVEGEWIEDDELESQVGQLLTWWTDSAPKSTTTGTRGRPKSEGGSAARTETLGFTVRIKCEKDGHVTTDSTDLNSARHGALLHFKSINGGERPKKGSALWQGLTDALTAVIEKGAQSAQGGSWIVDRIAS